MKGMINMMRQKIRLDTMSDVQNFVKVVSEIRENVILEDNDGHRVSATSILGALYSMEWSSIYCYCEKDISGIILPWIV